MSLYTTYKNNNLDAIYWQHGREQVSESRLEYYLKDHLGNTRLRVADMDGDGLISYKKYDPEHDDILSIHNYYPFGMEWDVPSEDEKGNSLVPTEPESRYTYNGKESIKELNIGLLDYGARYYDPAIARWTSVDPLAEEYSPYSGYNYVLNNPIGNIDPDGRSVDGIIVDNKGKVIGNDGIDDGKVYVTNDNISKNDKKFIKKNSGNTEAFASGFDYSNVTEIEGSSDTRQAMVDAVSGDNGKGGTSDANNREYGGSIMEDGTVVPGEPGAVTTPGGEDAAFSNYQQGDKTRFHSHPSGDKQQTEIVTDPFGGQSSSQVRTINYNQKPSKKDISNAGSTTRYVFGKRSGKVYMYNNTGVTATLPTKRFVKFKK